MSCKICNFNQVKDIDRLLLSGSPPPPSVKNIASVLLILSVTGNTCSKN